MIDEQIIPVSQNSPSQKELLDAIIQLQRIVAELQQAIISLQTP